MTAEHSRLVAPFERLAAMQRYGLIAAVALVMFVIIQLALCGLHSRSDQWRLHSREVVATATRVQVYALDRESGILAWMTTGESALLASERRAAVALAATLDQLAALTTELPVQRVPVDEIRSAVAASDSGFASPALAGTLGASERAYAGRPLFDPIRHRIGEFIAAEEAVYRARLRFDQQLSTLGMLGIILLLIVLGGAIFARSRRMGALTMTVRTQQDQLESQTVSLREQATSLEEQATELEEQATELEEQAAELESQVESLSAVNAELTRVGGMLEAAIDGAPIGFAFLDSSLRFVRVNEPFALLTSVPTYQHVGRRLMDVAPRASQEILR